MTRLNILSQILAALLFLLPPIISSAQSKPDTTEFTKVYADKFKSNLLIGAGLHLNNISPSKTGPYYAAGGRQYTSLLPEISFGTNLFTNPATAKVIFRLELSLTESRYRSNFQNEAEPYVDVRSAFDQMGFVVIPQILYNFYNGNNFKVYAGVGVALSLFKYSDVYYGPQDPTQSNAFFNSNQMDLKAFDDIILIKAGVQIGKHWGIFVNYIGSTYTTQSGYFSLTSNCKQAGLNYIFN